MQDKEAVKRYTVNIKVRTYAAMSMLAKVGTQELNSIEKIINYACEQFVSERTSKISNFDEVIDQAQAAMSEV